METLVLELNNIKQSFDAREILEINNLKVYEQDRIAIIGDNGAGKSTLLKIIAKELVPDEGQVLSHVEFKYHKQIEKNNDIDITDELDWDLIRHFDIPLTNIDSLSGGENHKYRLAKFFSTYEMGLLLDEPTTHLDKKSIELLIDQLKYYYGSLIFVSHDRYFLNNLANKIWVISDNKIKEYIGNYDDYISQKENEEKYILRENEKLIKEKAKIEKSILKKNEQISKSQKISAKKKSQNIKPDRLSSSKQKDTVQKNMQKTVKSMQSKLERLGNSKQEAAYKQIVFPTNKQIKIHNKYPIMGENVSISFGEKVVLDKVNFQFSLNKKIALIGDNGAGKSSLIKKIINQDEGIIISPKAKISLYGQEDYKYETDDNLLPYVLKETDQNESFIRAILNNLSFSQEDINKPLNKLSGGEATRLALALLFLKPSNILILDEPTNFLDIKTIEALEILIQNYKGTVLFTSHDLNFINKTADEIYEIRDKKILKVKS